MDFDDYVAARGPELLRFAYVLTTDAHRAEDLVQDVLIKVYRRWNRVQRSDNRDAYVHRMLVNADASWRRRLSNREFPGALDPLHAGEVTPDPSEASALRDDVLRRLRTLPRRARTVLVLRYYADHDDATIAEMLGIRPATVRALASRALTHLRTSQPTLVPDAPGGDR